MGPLGKPRPCGERWAGQQLPISLVRESPEAPFFVSQARCITVSFRLLRVTKALCPPAATPQRAE